MIESADINLNYYSEIQDIAEKIVKEYYNNAGEQKKTFCFPIDIRGIVNEMGIEVSEIDLNLHQEKQIIYNHGEMHPIITDKDRWRIYLEYKDNEPVKRYILAHELGHYLLQGKTLEMGMNCIDPFFSREKNELAADIMAACILFPQELVLQTLEGHLQHLRATNKLPIESVKWMSFLSEKAYVSMYHTIICYQHIKCCVREKSQVILEQYGELFL